MIVKESIWKQKSRCFLLYKKLHI